MKTRSLSLLCLLLVACGEDGPQLEVSSDAERCKDHLLAIHEGLVEYGRRTGRAPQSSGVAALGELFSSGVWPLDDEHRAHLRCPGPNAHAVPADTRYDLLEGLSAEHSSYAARNMRAHPLETYPIGGRDVAAMVACDNAGPTSNHEGVTNVLYTDGSIRTFVVEELIAAGTLPAGTSKLVVGPDSPIESLRVLATD